MTTTELIVTGRRAQHRHRPGASARRRRAASRTIQVVALSLGALVFLFPFYYMLIVSFSPSWTADWSVLVPGQLTLNNYAEQFESTNVGRSMINSAIFAGGVVLLTQIGALLCGYALAFIRFHGSRLVFGTVLLLQIVPFQVLLIPLYVLVTRSYGLGDSYAGMILPFAINAGVVFIYRQFFLTIPVEMIEAAKLDGAGHTRMLTTVALPLLVPSISSVTTLSFINTFNQFDIVYVMQGVQGNPNFSTDTLVTYFYRLAFGAEGAVGITDIGLALSLGTMLFLLLSVGTLLLLRAFDRATVQP